MDKKFKIVCGADCIAILIKVDDEDWSLDLGCHKDSNLESFMHRFFNLYNFGFKFDSIVIDKDYSLFD